jgi:autotransporter passenger strand-loop-strand repeat protein
MSATVVGPGETVTGGIITYPNTLEVENGGTANVVTVIGNSQGEGILDVDPGGVANKTVVGSGGSVNVDGTGNFTVVNSGGLLGMGGYGGGTAGGTLNNTTLNNGGSLVAASGTANNTTINKGGVISEQYQAIDRGSVVGAGGVEEANNGALEYGLFNSTVNSGGLQYLDGAYAYYTTVNSGGELHVSGGNIIEQYYNAGQSFNAVINAGGLELLESADAGNGGSQYWAISNNTVLAGGTEEVHTGGEAITTTVQKGGVLDNDSLASGTVLESGGIMNDNAGGTATGTIVLAGGNAIVYAGSTANNTIIGNGGIVTDSSGAVNGSTIQAGGFQGVWGAAGGAFIQAGGEQAIYNGGHATNDTIAGMEFIRAGGTASNEILASGGELSVAGGTMTGGVNFSTAGNAELSLASNTLSAVIYGFGSGDKIDLTALGFGTTTKPTFAGSTLTVATGSNHAALTFGGAYNSADFSVSNDGHGGTLVKFV